MAGGSGYDLVHDEISRSSESSPKSADLSGDWAIGLLNVHMRGVDVLRGIAILMVVIYHGFSYSFPYLTFSNRLAQGLFEATGIGWTGVNLFFVLSGFLITGNLIDSEQKPNFYSRFYLRRALRILPIYVVVLLVLWLTRQASGNFLVLCLLFMANVPGLFLRGVAWTGYGPLWSLAVEEQFYLLWPFFYRRLRATGLAVFCVALILLCPLLRGAALAGWLHTGDVFSKTWMIADNLAIGALLAITLRSGRLKRLTLVRVGAGLVASSAVGLILLARLGAAVHSTVLGGIFGLTLIECFFTGLLILALNQFRRARLPPSLGWLVFFGDISYGLYLLHLLCEQMYDQHLGKLVLLSSATNLLVRFVVTNGVALGLSTLSKRFFENPILHLKNRIPAAH